MQLQGDPIGVYIISVGILFALLFIIYLLAKKEAVPSQSGTLAQLGPYRNLSLLSDKGGMAKVYHAYHAEMGRECVLKVLRSDLLGDADTVKKFHREAELLKSIKRACPEAPVVQVFSTGTIATEFVELPFIEMEYIPGRTDLSDFLKEQGKLQPATAEKIVVQVVRALMAAHGEGAIHRDLKPGNILLYNGDPEKAVVCDFGVAKQVSSKSVTMGGYGTAAYMSPEQCGGSGEFTQASDIYSLALIWYEMLTGSRLFEEDNAFVLMQKHKEEDPAPYIRDHIPARYHELFMQMLAKDAQTRPALETVLSVLSSASLQIVGYRPQTIEIQTRNYKASTPLVGSKRNVAITSLVGLLFLLLVLTGYELYNKHLGGGGIAGIALQPTPTPMRVSAPETETPTVAWPPTPTPWSGRIAQVPTPTSTVVFSQEEEPGFLFAEPEPTQMEIEILNIQQPFHQGIELPPGEYHVEYSA
ncbi:protein kinase, partial [bacterium]|nr:protein kinase [bacterium]